VTGTAPLVITGGASLAISAASKLDGGITLDNGGLALDGPLTVAGNSTWKSGAILNNGGLTNTGTLTLSGTATMFLGTSLKKFRDHRAPNGRPPPRCCHRCIGVSWHAEQ
jgi:hypothetical protein